MIHAETHDLKKDLLIAAKELNNQSIYVDVVDSIKGTCNHVCTNVDLHAILLANQNSINYTLSCFKNRERHNKEPWILLVQVKLTFLEALVKCKILENSL